MTLYHTLPSSVLLGTLLRLVEGGGGQFVKKQRLVNICKPQPTDSTTMHNCPQRLSQSHKHRVQLLTWKTNGVEKRRGKKPLFFEETNLTLTNNK
ncbi:hypothetical protein T01_5782 [Trichinella spiralis]|uniref:Secreted protein n=1 Tax=Trichinella spiralis TaxID=6334 RepID=A0A0V1BCL1_TRISP|nr:hypothetical protein T01_5782 [Trichinella spiralis]